MRRRKKQNINYTKHLGRGCFCFGCIVNAQMSLMRADGDWIIRIVEYIILRMFSVLKDEMKNLKRELVRAKEEVKRIQVIIKQGFFAIFTSFSVVIHSMIVYIHLMWHIYISPECAAGDWPV